VWIAAALVAVIAVVVLWAAPRVQPTTGTLVVVAAGRDATGGGTHVSIDALGSFATCVASVESLRRRGRHVQVGLLPVVAGRPELPLDRVIGYELELRGSHGMVAHAYPELLGLVTAGVLRPDRLVTATIGLDRAPEALTTMDRPGSGGIRLIDPRI